MRTVDTQKYLRSAPNLGGTGACSCGIYHSKLIPYSTPRLGQLSHIKTMQSVSQLNPTLSLLIFKQQAGVNNRLVV
jgi:hypothetical protein